jgi:hypothetical protein
MASNIVAENKEKVAPKVEQLRGSQRSGSSGKEQPSNSFKKKSWYEMTMQDAQEQEAHDQRQVFEDGSKRDGRDRFLSRGSNHGSKDNSEERATSRW